MNPTNPTRPAVRWRYSATGKLHAQWADDTGGESVHSEESGLSGPSVPFDSETACPACVHLVRSVLTRDDREPRYKLTGKGNVGGNSAEARELNRERLQRVLAAAGTHAITTELLREWWPDMSLSAASMTLSRWAKNGRLSRISPGLYGPPKPKGATT